MLSRYLTTLAALALTSTVHANDAATPPALGYKDSYQLGYLYRLGDVRFIRVVNAGFHSPAPSFSPPVTRDICVNVYQLRLHPFNGSVVLGCCSCRVAPLSFGVRVNVGVASGPVSLIATRPAAGAPACSATRIPSSPALDASGNLVAVAGGFATGMRAWATYVDGNISIPDAADLTESAPFLNAPLSADQLRGLVESCSQDPLVGGCSCE
jgi:hypothetical protein